MRADKRIRGGGKGVVLPGWIGVAYWVAAILAALPVAAAEPAVEMAQVEAAILATDNVQGDLKARWTPVLKLLAGVSPQTTDPVLRLIKGHVCLAVNENNESLCLFLSVFRSEDLAKYQRWAASFAGAHRGSAEAQYFLGDALARQEKWDDALAAFTAALKSHPQHPLLLSSRGVAHAAKRQWDEAICDLDDAARAAPELADAHANSGAVCLHRSAGARGALEAFERALRESPDFALALIGRACAKFALGRFGEARKDLDLAKAKSSCIGPIYEQNLVKMLAYVAPNSDPRLAKLSQRDLGMQLDKAFRDFTGNPNKATSRAYFDSLNVAKYAAPEAYSKSLTQLKVYSEINRNFTPTAAPYVNELLRTNMPTGGARLAVSSIPTGVNVTTPYGGGGVSGMGTQRQQLYVIDSNFATAVAMNKNLSRPSFQVGNQRYEQPGGAYGGVSGSLQGARLDEGNWPFVACYGLVYMVTTTPVPANR